jgi:hypothetical protein
MPVTAKLSRKFYDELRELNELNFARFDAKLEQRVAELRRDLDVGLHQLKAELVKWMFLFWAGTTFTVLGVMIALLKL